MSTAAPSALAGQKPTQQRYLFIACFVSLVATSFAFIIRAMLLDAWKVEFNLAETEMAQISAAGLWPFGISIILFSLVIDRIGYGKCMIFAFACHVASAVLLFTAGGADGYTYLYVGSILNGLAAGTVEAVINPAVTTLYPKSKTKMLSILHAGWPGGLVLGGILVLLMGDMSTFTLAGAQMAAWKLKVAIVLIPVLVYGLLMLWCRFPVNERVAAGVPYRDMLKEAGAIGALIVVIMVVMEIGRILDASIWSQLAAVAVCTIAYLLYTRSLGRGLYILLLLVMVLLAITELSVDSWIPSLMQPAMDAQKLPSGLVLVYTAAVMMILRFCIGPIERKLKPLGVLLGGSILAAIGLASLSQAAGVTIILAATVYAAGKAFFWPVTLGIVSQRFPRGGALTLNAMGGAGMLAAGVIGANLLGNLQDTRIDRMLLAENPALHAQVMSPEAKDSVFSKLFFAGQYRALDQAKTNAIMDQYALYEEASKAKRAPAELAGNKEYQNLVYNTMHHLAPAEPAKPAQTAAAEKRLAYSAAKASYDAAAAEHGTALKTYSGQIAYLMGKGMIVDAASYAQISKQKDTLLKITAEAKRNAMTTIAAFPVVMALCYLGLIIYFRAKGGYKAVELTREGAREVSPTLEKELADQAATPDE